MTHWTEEFFVDNANLYMQELQEMDELAEEEADELLSLVLGEFDHSPSTVLDVGCGLGRHSLEFAKAGLDVTGIDISPDYVAEARDRAEDASVADQTTFREWDMRNLDSMSEKFDLIVCLYNTLGYFDDETNIEILQKMRQRLTDSGLCCVQVMNKDTALINFQPDMIHEHSFGVVVAQHNFNTQTSQMEIARDVLRGEAPNLEYEGRVEYKARLYSPPELEQAFSDAGFEEVTLFGGYDGQDVSLDSGKLVVVVQ